MRSIAFAVLLASTVCIGQTPPSPNEVQHLRFILLSVASLDHDPDAIRAFEDNLAKQFGLTPQESSVIHAAGQSLKPLLAQNRRVGQATVAASKGKGVLARADVDSLHALDAQREQTIANLSTQILNSVRPETVARLLAAGNILAAKGKKSP